MDERTLRGRRGAHFDELDDEGGVRLQPLGLPPDGGEELEEAAGRVRVARAGGLVELASEDGEELFARGLERLCGGKMALGCGLNRCERTVYTEGALGRTTAVSANGPEMTSSGRAIALAQ